MGCNETQFARARTVQRVTRYLAGIRISVPTLVPKPGSPNVTQEHVPGYKSDALSSVRSPWVTLDREICSLKIRVSLVQSSRVAAIDAEGSPKGKRSEITPHVPTVFFRVYPMNTWVYA